MAKNIVLTPLQCQCVDSVCDWYKKKTDIKHRTDRDQIFYIGGYAGTGKTSIVPYIMQQLGVSDDRVCYATFTAKAALVLAKKLGRKVNTIHSLCYELVDDVLDPITQKPIMTWRLRRESPLKNAKVLVLDEVSMVNKLIMDDLKKFGVKILVLGDPFQLPPVEGDAYFHEGYKPDFFLDEIHRQALENPIIWLSQHVRQGNDIDFGKYGNKAMKIRSDDASEELYMSADQVIAGTNKTRRNFNNWFRKQLGRDEKNSVFPVVGDKLICLKNDRERGLANGSFLHATSDANVAHNRETFKLCFTQDDSDDEFTDIMCSSAEVLGGVKLGMPYWEQKKLLNVDYGYVITCHKSQGSQYGDVLFLDEGFGRWLDDNTYYRHLYTAITRAEERLIIVA